MTDDKKFDLSRRKVLGSIGTIGVASAAAGAGTMAYFSDTQKSTGNTVSAGTLDLGSTSTTGFTVTNAAPGNSGLGGTISATYNGSVGAVEVDISGASLSDDSKSEAGEYSDEQSGADFAKQLKLDTAIARNKTKSTSTDLLSKISDSNDNNRVDLHDFVKNAPYDDVFGDVADGDKIELKLSMTLVSSTGNAFQNDGMALDVTFEAQQPGKDS